MGKKRKPFKKPDPQAHLLEPSNWQEIVKESTFFAQYYCNQKIVPEVDWTKFLDTLKEMLPLSYRFIGSSSKASLLSKRMMHDFIKGLPENIPRPFQTTWYPDQMSWQHHISRSEIRSNELLKEYHKFLLTEADCGNLVRQELVSQIPPLLLDVQPHHYVLDMCASPGSKTSQLIDLLHKESRDPSGLIVANDASNPRCYTMTHNLKRLGSPCLIVTNHNAITMPNMDVLPETRDSSESTRILMYDRVLCDVPCTGDATLRKNYTIWAKWHSKNGNSLHRLQLAILKRGIHLLKSGGRLVYSTCSFNPVENEAVINAAINFFGTNVIRLLDVSDELPGLIREKGLKTWSVYADETTSFKSFDDYKARKSELPDKLKLQPTVFPSPEDKANEFQLERCVRILPQKQNTGGFFVAVIEKLVNNSKRQKLQIESFGNNSHLSNANAKSEDSSRENCSGKANEPGSAVGDEDALEDLNADSLSFENAAPPPAKQARFKGFKEDPFVYMSDIESDLCVASLKNDFGVSNSFSFHNLLKRKDTDGGRKVSYTTDIVRRIISANDNSKLKVIHAGALVMERRMSEESDLAYRIVQDGLSLMLDHLSKRRICMKRDDVTKVLINDSVSFKNFSGNTQKELEDTGSGCIIITFEPQKEQLSVKPDCDALMSDFAFCAWKGRYTVRAYVKACEKEHFMRLAGYSHDEVKSMREHLPKPVVNENASTDESMKTESVDNICVSSSSNKPENNVKEDGVVIDCSATEDKNIDL